MSRDEAAWRYTKHVSLAAVFFITARLAVPALACAQQVAAAPAPPIATPRDEPFPGVITLAVDATDVDRAIFRVRESVPISRPGPMTLLYPEWLPGGHGPSGAIQRLSGLRITANGRPVLWRRDPVNVFAFHLDAPVGAMTLDVSFQFLSATQSGQDAILVTPDLLALEWGATILYPAGYYASRIMVAPSVTLPEGWEHATALRGESGTGNMLTFETVTLAALVDSPVMAGRFYREVDLDPGGAQAVRLHLFADRPDQLVGTDAEIAAHRRLVHQADLLFGSRHFAHYDFLVALSDTFDNFGLEHHQSSENGAPGAYFTDWNSTVAGRDLLPHEYAHSWNGKYRRPADLWAPSYETPTRNSLLWIYEGQTQYWGEVLAARSGLWSQQEALDSLARTAAALDNSVGRTWRPLSDTTNALILPGRSVAEWRSWQRGHDYYGEGHLIWLDVDMLIRERTGGRRSLDDFARAFFGGHPGESTPVTYTLDDVVSALNRILPFDWSTFLSERVEHTSARAPLDGLTRGGYSLVYTEQRSDFQQAYERSTRTDDFEFSLGFTLDRYGSVCAVQWDSPVFERGITVGAQVVAVNSVAYDAATLRRVVTEAKTTPAPIALLMRTGSYFRTVIIDYHRGLRYPRLERIPGTTDRFSLLLRPRR